MSESIKKKGLFFFFLNKTGNSIVYFPHCSGSRLAGFHETPFLEHSLLISFLSHQRTKRGLAARVTLGLRTAPLIRAILTLELQRPQHQKVLLLKLLNYCTGMTGRLLWALFLVRAHCSGILQLEDEQEFGFEPQSFRHEPQPLPHFTTRSFLRNTFNG